MKRLFLMLMAVVVMLESCNKKDGSSPVNPVTPVTPVTPTQPVTDKITYTVDSLNTRPSIYLTLTADHTITKDTCTVVLGNTSVRLIKLDALHYFFMVPVLAPGTYNLDLKNIDAANTPIVTITNYTAISNSDAFITQLKIDYNNLVDTLKANSLNNSVTAADAVFMHQLMEQITENLNSCTPEQKLAIAYQLQNITLDQSLAKPTLLDTSYFMFRIMDDFDEEISSQMTKTAIKGKLLTGSAKIAAVAVAFSVGAMIYTAGNPYSIASLLVTYTAYKLLTKAAAAKNAEASNITGIAEDINDESGHSDVADPLDLPESQSIWQKLQGKFRTLQHSDNNGLSNDVTEMIKQSDELEQQDNTLKRKFDDLKAQFSSFFSKISASYTAYVSPILVTAKQKIAEAKSKFVSVTNVSNPDIALTISDDGTKGLKIITTNPAKNITTEKPFTYQVNYTQTAINKKVSAIIHAKYKPFSVPVLSTSSATSITQTSANCGGNITKDGGTPVINRGVCWSITTNPTTANSKTSDGAGTGNFASSITGLTPNITYYIRAYAANSVGTGYGNLDSFKTSPLNVASLSTLGSSGVTSTTATTGGSISSDGGSPVTLRGVCYNTSGNPTIMSDIVYSGSGTGNFICSLKELIPNKKYYFRAFATNAAGTAYGAELDFMTLVAPPVITTIAVTDIKSTTANSGGIITSDGGVAIFRRGVCWSTTPDPTIGSGAYTTQDGTGTGTFTSSVTPLFPGYPWYLRAYMMQFDGKITYGNQVTITTPEPIWDTKNLDVSTYRNGDPIPQVTDPAQWMNLTTGAWCYYNNDPANAIYGKIYNAYAVTDPRGLAPSGKRIPNTLEFAYLFDDGSAGIVINTASVGRLKTTGTMEAGTGLWWQPNTDATNASGFSALPGGYRPPQVTPDFYGKGFQAFWWSSTKSSQCACQNALIIDYESKGTNGAGMGFANGLYVRCIKD